VRAYVYILHKLVRVLDGLPPETAAAVLLVALTHPGVLSFVVLTVAGGIVSWSLASIFAIHVWPELPPEHQRALLKLRDRSLLKLPEQDRPSRSGALGSRGRGVHFDREDDRNMPEDPRTLIAEARKVAADCETYLEAAVELVDDLPADRERVFERIAAAEERRDRAREEWHRLLREADAGGDVTEWHIKEAEEAYYSASSRSFRLRWYLDFDDIDPEHRKAIARQMAGLLREDSEQRLGAIAAGRDDAELQRTVAECKEEVAGATRYVVNRFRPARDLPLDEVRKARAEASEILDRLRNPSAD
jgi:hypothetical protein